MTDYKTFSVADNMSYALLDAYAWQMARDAELSAYGERTVRGAREVREGLEKAARAHGYWFH